MNPQRRPAGRLWVFFGLRDRSSLKPVAEAEGGPARGGDFDARPVGVLELVAEVHAKQVVAHPRQSDGELCVDHPAAAQVVHENRTEVVRLAR